MRNYVSFFILLCSPLAYATCAVTDDLGETIQLQHPAQRIISLAPDITETFYTIDAGHHLVGAIDGSDHPAAAKKLNRVGSYAGLDLERIIQLHPDLIVRWSTTFTRQIIILKKMGIPVYTSTPKRLEDVPRTMQQLGCLAGTQQQANREARHFTASLQRLQQQYVNGAPLTVFFQIGSYGLMTINQESWINQVITLCGGKNIFANAMSITPEVSLEAVIAANPDVILSTALQSDWQARWQRWPMLAAVRNQRLYAINPDLIERPGPRLIEGALKVCTFLHKNNIKKVG